MSIDFLVAKNDDERMLFANIRSLYSQFPDNAVLLDLSRLTDEQKARVIPEFVTLKFINKAYSDGMIYAATRAGIHAAYLSVLPIDDVYVFYDDDSPIIRDIQHLIICMYWAYGLESTQTIFDIQKLCSILAHSYKKDMSGLVNIREYVTLVLDELVRKKFLRRFRRMYKLTKNSQMTLTQKLPTLRPEEETETSLLINAQNSVELLKLDREISLLATQAMSIYNKLTEIRSRLRKIK